MAAWHILIVSLPTKHATERMRVWRALKALGSVVLRDGVYLLPAREELRAALKGLADEVMVSGGQAHVLSLDATDERQEAAFCALFDRAPEYAELQAGIDALRGKLRRGAPAVLTREAAQLHKHFAALAAVDYFPGPAREQVASALGELEHELEAKLNPGEPHAAHGKIKRLKTADYQGRTWATRKHMWVDRMASAWLIASFIDSRAKFKWLNKPADCPKRALGFDFDGASFTHVGPRVTFEVLLASFGLDADPALTRIGGIVHFLDVGGVPVPEAAGLVAVLRGLREAAPDDDALLASVTPVFDGLYAGMHEAA